MPNSAFRSFWRGPLLGLGLLAGLAMGLAIFHYFTGDDYTLRVQPVAQLRPVPLVVEQVRVGLDALPIRANGYLTTQTHDVTGPYVRPDAAAALLVLLAGCLAYFLAVVSTLPRAAFVAGMAGLIFLLMSLNVDLLGLIDAREQYFLIITLLGLGLPAFALHAFWPQVGLGSRLLLFGGLVAGLGAAIFGLSPQPADTTALHLVSFATSSGAVVVALLVLWVAFENIRGLLWLNTQAENPASRFGLLPFLLVSGLYLLLLGLYYFGQGEVYILPNVRLEPFVLLLTATVVGGLGLQRRAATYQQWVPYWPAAPALYLILTTLAAGFLGYAFATANDPLLSAGREFTALALLVGGAVFLLYVLVNFAPLIRQRLRVYRVVYEPRRLPFYAMYLFALGALFAVELRHNFYVLNQVKAGYFNNLGDLTRLQSEQQPAAGALALLAERYYAESDLLDQHNHRASWGRAALYRFRAQRQNEINALRRALSRQPSEKISLRLAALFTEPTDFFDRLRLLREGLRSAPRSARLANDLAQLYTRSSLTDSVNHYFNRAEALQPGNPVVQANRLAYLLQLNDLATARQLAASPAAAAAADDPAWQSNWQLLRQLTGAPLEGPTAAVPATALTPAAFGRLYHETLRRAGRGDTSQLPALTRLAADSANADYTDQLTFLRALLLQYGGRPGPAQVALLPLAAGTTPASAYYQNLAGLWLLDVGAYALAAERFAEARRNGDAEAPLAQAYALTLAGQPDSARAAAAAARQSPALAQRPATRRLQQVLSADFARNYSAYQASPDSLKAQFLVLRGQEVLPTSSDGYSWYGYYIEKLTSPAAHDAALLAQAARLAAVRAPETAEMLKTHPLRSGSAALAAERSLLYGQALLYAPRNQARLGRLLDSATFRPVDGFRVLALRAALADYRQQPRAAARLYARLVAQAPFLPDVVLTAADFSTRQRQYLTAYNFLSTGLVHNPESIALLQAHSLAAVSAGLSGYASESLEKLRQLLSPAEYHTFHAQYEAQRSAQAASAARWD